MLGVLLFEIVGQSYITLHMAIVCPNLSCIHRTVLVALAWQGVVSLFAVLAVAGTPPRPQFGNNKKTFLIVILRRLPLADDECDKSFDTNSSNIHTWFKVA